jgi:hypothetical protein
MYSDTQTKTTPVIPINDFETLSKGVEVFTPEIIKGFTDKAINSKNEQTIEKAAQELALLRTIDVATEKGVVKMFYKAVDIEKGEYFENELNKRLGLEGSVIEKGAKAQIGEKRTWGGIEYEKTVTGWVPSKKNKGGANEDQSTSAKNKDGQGDLSSHAASASREALENAIKQSTDPKVREAAHLELKRREHQEEGKIPKKEKGGEDPGQDKNHPEHNPFSDKTAPEKKEEKFYAPDHLAQKYGERGAKFITRRVEQDYGLNGYDDLLSMESEEEVEEFVEDYIEEWEEKQASKKQVKKASNPDTILQTPILESIEKAMKGGNGIS